MPPSGRRAACPEERPTPAELEQRLTSLASDLTVEPECLSIIEALAEASGAAQPGAAPSGNLHACRTGSGFRVRSCRAGSIIRGGRSMPEVRAFVRQDRDQLLSLANHHIATVLPGGSILAATLLSAMERDAGEYVIDPWVIDRHTIVGVERDRVVAAAHLKRYGTAPQVSASYLDAGSIDWIICWPDQIETGRLVLQAALDRLREWGVRIWYADGTLPCLGVYGIPEAWPHVRGLLTEAGFDDADGHVEIVFAGNLADVAPPGPPPIDGLTLRRSLGTLGTAFEAVAGDEVVGLFEVEDGYTNGGSIMKLDGWADVGNHRVREDLRGRGVGSWLFRHGCAWLRLGGSRRLLAYATEDENLPSIERHYGRHGLVPINRTRRGWMMLPT
jgi:GNAT superfamily N-acetyltransferase